MITNKEEGNSVAHSCEHDAIFQTGTNFPMAFRKLRQAKPNRGSLPRLKNLNQVFYRCRNSLLRIKREFLEPTVKGPLVLKLHQLRIKFERWERAPSAV